MTNISNKVPGGDWKLPNLPQTPGKPEAAAAGGGVGEPAPPAPGIDIESILPKFPGKPVHPVKPSIGLELKSDLKADIEQIRNSKGGGNIQALLEFKDNLNASTTKELEKVQSYLVDEMASPDNKDDQLLGALLKAVNGELNERRGPNRLDPHFPIKPLPHFHGDDHIKPIIKGGEGPGRVVD